MVAGPTHPLTKFKQVFLRPVQLVLMLAIAPLAFVLWLIYTIGLHIVIWNRWCRQGKDVLFIYSDSPIWRDYLEKTVLPHIANRAFILNWSEREHWKSSLATMAFQHFGGHRQFNPLALVFRPFRLTRTFRFWKPFRDFKHGNTEPLERVKGEFFDCLGVQRPSP